MTKTQIQIATHILYDCVGDNCECCDWSDADRDAMEAMTLEEADAIVSEYEGSTPMLSDGDNMTDAEADADVLASAGWGTDEDYGYYGRDD